MAIGMCVEGVRAITEYAFEADVPPADVRRLGKGGSAIGDVSVVGIIGDIKMASANQLIFHPDDSVILNTGQTNRCLIIRLNEFVTSAGEKLNTETATVAAQVIDDGLGRGDAAFFAATEQYLEPYLVQMGRDILNEVRKSFPGQLIEGKARKWVNYPDNFLAITIQNRDQSFAVYIKGIPDRFHAPSLELKRDRPGYIRFKLSDPKQLPDAIRVILDSAKKAV